MPLVQDLSKAQIAFQIAGRDIDQFQAMRYRGTEGLCQLYRFEVDLAAAEEGLVLESIVGKAAALSINTPTGERWFHGIISRFEMSGETVGQTYFRAELVPSVWLMTHRYNCRIFQNKTIQEIITKLLEGAGIAADRFRFNLKRTFQPREYCVQYRETDYNFICRLMEEEGIFWYFEHKQDGHTLVMEDSNAAAVPIEGEPKVVYRPPTGLNIDIEHVFRFRISQSVRPGAVVLNDFNFENPKLALESKAAAKTADGKDRDAGLEFIDFPGEYIDQARGTELAKLRAEEFEASRITAVGQSTCKRLTPGRVFELTEHASIGFNGKYYITTMMHEGKESVRRTTTGSNGRTSVLDARIYQSILAARTDDQSPQVRELAQAVLQIAERIRAGDPTARRSLTQWVYHAGQVARDLTTAATVAGANALEWLTAPNLVEDVARVSVVDFDAPVYQCRFECIKAATSYRPPRVTPWPVVRGTQTARVVGPEGEEIHTDKFGRVKVQFHWDREGSEAGQPKRFGADSSCFIRVSQGMAGGAYGMLFLPRVGQEVVVDFLEGNPDQPIIIGRVYNADHMPPYTLPDEKTKSVIKTHTSKEGGGNNEIRFEDLKDKEQLFIQAQRQMDTNVKASHFESIGGSYHLTVGGEKDGEVFGEYRQKVFKLKQTHVKEERRAWIEKDDSLKVDGSRSEGIGGTLSVTVGKDVVEKFDANHKHEVAANLVCTAANIKIEAASILELKGAGGTITIGPGGIWIVGTTVFINSGSGPPAPPVSAVAAGPQVAEDPSAADSSKPGKDTRYSGPSGAIAPLPEIPEVPGHDFPPEEPPKPPDTHMIEIELKDEAGQPIAGERYEITTPDGKIRRGTTDANGHAKETGLKAGQCQITFPRLDAEAWARA